MIKKEGNETKKKGEKIRGKRGKEKKRHKGKGKKQRYGANEVNE
jgi:hypothetical protein